MPDNEIPAPAGLESIAGPGLDPSPAAHPLLSLCDFLVGKSSPRTLVPLLVNQEIRIIVFWYFVVHSVSWGIQECLNIHFPQMLWKPFSFLGETTNRTTTHYLVATALGSDTLSFQTFLQHYLCNSAKSLLVRLDVPLCKVGSG